MADIKSMTLEQAKAYKAELKAQGKTQSTSKEFGKLEDYIKTLTPEKYGEETVQSAYEKLSSGVTERGGWTEANIEELHSRGIYPNLDPIGGGADGGLGSFLDSYQDGVYDGAGSVELREQIKAQLEPDMDKPDPFSRVESYEAMREEYGVEVLESQLNDLKAAIRDQYAQRTARTQAAEGQPVAMGVIAGRVTEIERQEAERIDILNREAAYINDQLNTAYNTISTYINYQGLDYQDAVQAYNTEFNQNLQIYKLVDEELDEQEAAARANLQTYQNAILAGNIDYDSLSGDQKTFINKLELQSGLPIGFTSSLQVQGKVLSTTTRTSGGQKYADVITQMPDGTMDLQTIPLGAAGTGDGDYTTKTSDKYLTQAGTILAEQDVITTQKYAGYDLEGNVEDTSDKLLSRAEAEAARSRIISLVGDEEEGRALFDRAWNAGGYGIWGE